MILSHQRALLGLLFILVFFGHAFNANAGIFELMSKGTQYLSQGQTCAKYDETTAKNKIQNLKNCLPDLRQSFSRQAQDLNQIKSSIDGTAKDNFFALLAHQHALEYVCSANFVDDLINNKSDVQSDLEEKLKLLRQTKQKLNTASAQITSNPNIIGKTCPLTIDDLKPNPLYQNSRDEYFENCSQVIKSRAAYNAILSSMPLSTIPSIQKSFESYASLTDGAQLESINKNIKGYIKSAYRDAKSSLLDQASKLEARLQKNGGRDFDRNDRRALLSDPRIVTKIAELSSNDEDIKTIACHADAEYGQGADRLDTGLMIGSVLLSGGYGIAARAASTSIKIQEGVATARSMGLLSANATRALQWSAIGTTSLSSYSNIDKSCQENSLLQLKSTATDEANRCVSAPSVEQLPKDNCYLAMALAALDTSLVKYGTNKEITTYLKTTNTTPAKAKIGSTSIEENLASRYKDGKISFVEKNSTDSKSVAEWKKYSRDYQITTTENIRKNSATYVEAVRNGDPHINFLRKLGYKFELDQSGKLYYEVPPLEKSLKKYEQLMQEQIDKGTIAADDVLIPGRIFIVNDEYKILRFGEKIPAGAKTEDALLEKADFEKIIGEKKFSIIGENGTHVLQGHTPLEHDLAHLSGFADHPEYQVELSKLMKLTTNNQDWHAQAIYKSRAFYVSELLEGTTSANRKTIESYLGQRNLLPTDSKLGAPSSIDDFKKIISNSSDQELIKITNDLYENRFKLMSSAGGSARDFIYRKSIMDDPNYAVQLRGPIGRSEVLQSQIKNKTSLTESQRQQVAELLASVENTSHFSFADFAKASGQQDLIKGTPEFTYICKNMLLGDHWRNMFCPP